MTNLMQIVKHELGQQGFAATVKPTATIDEGIDGVTHYTEISTTGDMYAIKDIIRNARNEGFGQIFSDYDCTGRAFLSSVEVVFMQYDTILVKESWGIDC